LRGILPAFGLDIVEVVSVGIRGCRRHPVGQLLVVAPGARSAPSAMNGILTRLRFGSPRDLATAASLALVAALVLEKAVPRGKLDDFFTGTLLGLSIGIGFFALAAYRRSRSDGSPGVGPGKVNE
jgi:hypothetical protein